jgi:short-subunit dehydrogenase
MFRRYSLDGSRILLTGASSGIGWALAERLAAEKAQLVLTARSAGPLHTLARQLEAQGIRARALPCDLQDAEARRQLVAEAVSWLGGLDVLVNNAGVGANGFFVEASEERLRRIFEVNFFAATELTRLALPHLQQGRDPMIVNVSSVIGRRAIPGYIDYCASKFALCGWSEALRGELVRFGIHVLLVCPGLIATPFREHQLESKLSTRFRDEKGMSPERCARAIVKAMRKHQYEVVITLGGKFLLWLNRWFPRVTDFLVNRYLLR